MQEITITVRVDFDTVNKKVKEPIALALVRTAARELITNMMMISDSRKPQIAVSCGDFFSANEDIELFGEGEENASKGEGDAGT